MKMKRIRKTTFEKVRYTNCGGSGITDLMDGSISYNRCDVCEATGYVFYNRKNHKQITESKYSKI